MNARETARRLGGEVSRARHDLVSWSGVLTRSHHEALNPRRPIDCPAHSHRASRRGAATGRQSIAITHQRNRHGATSLATVAKGVCLHHEKYLTSCDALQGRAGNHISCAACGKRLCPKQGSRRMRFCDAACRQSAFRAKNGHPAMKGAGPLRSVPNTPAGSRTCNGNFGDRGSGIHGPMEVISRELFEGFIWRPAVSLDGVRVEVAQLGVVPSPAKSVVDKTRTSAAGVR